MQHAFAKATACARTSSLREEETGGFLRLLGEGVHTVVDEW
jgi:hypothetical protein